MLRAEICHLRGIPSTPPITPHLALSDTSLDFSSLTEPTKHLRIADIIEKGSRFQTRVRHHAILNTKIALLNFLSRLKNQPDMPAQKSPAFSMHGAILDGFEQP